MRFSKYHGLGNDFVILDGGLEGVATPSRADVVALCRRGHGIGADGVMLARPPSDPALADLRMELVNSDGSIPEMCGNGLRCFVKYAVDALGHSANPLRVETNGGVLACVWTADAAGVRTVRVDMGRPRFERASVPVQGEGQADEVQVPCEDRVFVATGVNTGNPHMVIFGDATLDTALRWGPLLTTHPMWPQGANVEFADVTGPDHLTVTVWERGCGLTQACGTGATATAAAAVRRGLMPFDAPIRVSLPGGDLAITIAEGFRTAFMEGPATLVYRGELAPGWRG